MTRILALGLVAMALLFAAPRAQTAIGQGSSLDRMVRNLEDTVLKIDVRLERLEALAALRSPTLYDPKDTVVNDPGPARTDTPQWVMEFDGVDTVEPDPDAYKELEQMRKDYSAVVISSPLTPPRLLSENLGRLLDLQPRSRPNRHIV